MPNNTVDEWVRYARNNIESAIREMDRQCNPRLRPYEIILHNCHQSAEKIIKAYLLSQNGTFPKEHDIRILRKLCAKLDSDFNKKRVVNHCSYLNMFWNIKYPDVTVQIDASEATRGINSAKRIFDFVSGKLGHGKLFTE